MNLRSPVQKPARVVAGHHARWIHRHRNRGCQGRVDETYIRVSGVWTYLYRAVDSNGETIDFILSPQRDMTAAKLFLRQVLGRPGLGRPRVINVDGHPSYPRAIRRSEVLGRAWPAVPMPAIFF
jgi:transposase-like protein